MTDSAHTVRPPAPEVSTASTSTARFDLPAATFALGDLFDRVPDARAELDPTIANPDDHALVAVHADGDECTVDAAIRSDAGVAAVERFGERADGWAYRITWEGRPRRLIRRLVTAGVTVLSACGRNGRWRLRVLTPDRAGIRRASDVFDALDCRADCRSVSRFADKPTRSRLTDEQREAIRTAFEAGYYNVPRDATLSDISNRLGISHQALSERFRRAHEKLIANELLFE
jgi:predicted DNA binding protein